MNDVNNFRSLEKLKLRYCLFSCSLLSIVDCQSDLNNQTSPKQEMKSDLMHRQIKIHFTIQWPIRTLCSYFCRLEKTERLFHKLTNSLKINIKIYVTKKISNECDNNVSWPRCSFIFVSIFAKLNFSISHWICVLSSYRQNSISWPR